MPYYSTLADDVARAKELLRLGLHGSDRYLASKLLESFVAAIEAVDVTVCEVALRQVRAPDGGVCRTRGCGHAARLHVGSICQACACDGWS